MLGIPYRFSDTPAGVSSAPPILGVDTDTVLADLCGIAKSDLDTLRGDGVI